MHTIPMAQRLRRMRVENPWWDEVPPQTDLSYRNMRPRACFRRFVELLEARDTRRAIVLMGPRRVGKTVLLHHTVQHLLDNGIPPCAVAFLSLDQPLYANLSIEEFAGHLREADWSQGAEQAFLFLDEIQYLPDWERHLKVFVDTCPTIRCIVSGSAAAALRLKSIESGAGRFTDFLLPPLTFHEYLCFQGMEGMVRFVDGSRWEWDDIDEINEHFIRYLNIGGYPEVVFSETIQKDVGRYVRSDIIEKVLLRDLPSLYGIQDIRELHHLFLALAWNTAREVSPDALSGESGVTKPTIKRYLEYLEAAFLLKAVHRIDRNARRFKRANSFKVYLTNPSMRCALFGPVSDSDEDIGALAETAVFSQLFHGDRELHYARWSGGEVDIVGLDSRQRPEWCVEVKWSDRILARRRQRDPLKAFLHNNPCLNGVRTTRTKAGTIDMGHGRQVYCVPTSVYCYVLGMSILGAVPGDWPPPVSHFSHLDSCVRRNDGGGQFGIGF